MNYTVEIDRSVSALCYCLERLNNEVDNINEWEWAYVVIDGQEYDVVCVDEVEDVGENEYWFK